MDQINIVDDKINYRTQISVVLICEDSPVKTKINRVIFNEMLHSTPDLDDILNHITGNMVEVASEEPHIAECKSCAARTKPLMSMVKNAVRDNSDGGYYVYCVMKSTLPHFRYSASNEKIVTDLNFKRYEVRVRRFEMVTESDTAQDSLAGLAQQLPGVKAKVRYPCECAYGTSKNRILGGDTIMDVVIHLNDNHQWTREEIADWLDAVDDPENGVDLAFKVPEKEEV